jgi:hypothetical protein
MILAEQAPILAIIVGFAILIGLAFGALFLFRGYEHLARRSLKRQFADLRIHPEPQPGDVILIYHTYHGFLVWFTQTPHQIALPPADACKLLGRLLRFNLLWGLVSPGALFIPLLAILNYLAQRRSIAAQEAVGGLSALNIKRPNGAAVNAPHPESIVISESPSLFRRFVGWIAAGLCITFGISATVCLVTGKFDAAIGVAVLAALLGRVAREWLGKAKTIKA